MRVSLQLQQGSYTLGHTVDKDHLEELHLSVVSTPVQELAFLHAKESTRELSLAEYITDLENCS
jgi:hypothetical protein